MDKLIPVPAGMSRHDVHRHMYSIAQGRKVLWSDEGGHIRVRFCDEVISPDLFSPGEDRLITVKVDASTSCDMRRVRFNGPSDVERFYRNWLILRAQKMGFEIKSLFMRRYYVPQTGRAKPFDLGVCDYSCLVQIVDPQLFARTLQHGVPKTTHSYGMGLIVIY